VSLRILHVLDHSAPLHSGYAFRTASILREQRALGWTPVPVTGVKQGSTPEPEQDIDGVHYQRTQPPRGPLARVPVVGELLGVDRLARRVRAVAAGGRFDLIHAHSPVLGAMAAFRAARLLGLPVVYEVRALWEDAAVDHGTQRAGSLRYRLTRTLETRAVRQADAVTVICEGLLREFCSRGVPESKITVIPNAVDTGRFQPGGIRDVALARELGLEGARVLGFIGSFYGYEGLPLLLRALPRIIEQEPTARVLLAGGGPEDDLLRALARDLGIADRVVFLGRVPHRDVGRYYDLVDLLVYPRLSTRTTEIVTPLKPLEAMAQGRMLVASDVGGHRELIRDGVTGLLFRAGDPEALAARAVELLRAPERWPELRAAGRAFVEQERTWAASVQRYESVYAAALGTTRGGG
jgi:PEP-CTERM/exosortase A-associated glycosyltransferase